jgi:hypothetical protein
VSNKESGKNIKHFFYMLSELDIDRIAKSAHKNGVLDDFQRGYLMSIYDMRHILNKIVEGIEPMEYEEKNKYDWDSPVYKMDSF